MIAVKPKAPSLKWLQELDSDYGFEIYGFLGLTTGLGHSRCILITLVTLLILLSILLFTMWHHLC